MFIQKISFCLIQFLLSIVNKAEEVIREDFDNTMIKDLKIAEEPEEVPLDVMFAAYCRMDPISDSMGLKLLPLSQSDNWLTSAKILDTHKVTSTDTGLCFFKFRKRAINFEEYLNYLKDLAKTKGLNFEDMKFAMQRCGKPIHPKDIKLKIK